MTILDGIAGVIRSTHAQRSARADTSDLLAEICGPAASTILRAAEHDGYSVALGVAQAQAENKPNGFVNDVAYNASDSWLAISGFFTHALPRTPAPAHAMLADVLEHGSKVARHWRGAFASALWRKDAATLTLTRDHIGQRPLYFCRIESGIAFASTLRALVRTGLTTRRIAPAAIEIYLFNGFMVSPLTVIDGVFSVMPGQSILFSAAGETRDTTYFWSQPSALSASSTSDRKLTCRASPPKIRGRAQTRHSKHRHAIGISFRRPGFIVDCRGLAPTARQGPDAVHRDVSAGI